MHVVFKYPIPNYPTKFSLSLPLRSEVVALQLQKGSPQIWVRLNKQEVNLQVRNFQIVGTGEELEDLAKYIDTFQQGDLVWHLFEV